MKNLKKQILFIALSLLVLINSFGAIPSVLAEEDDDTDGEFISDELFAFEEPVMPERVVLTAATLLNPFVKTDFNSFLTFDYLEAATNVEWEVEGIPESNYEEKVNMMINGDNLPDALFHPGTNIQGKYYNTGLFLPLDELLEDYAPTIAEVYEDPVVRANAASPDGHVYITPAGEIAPWLDDGNEIFVNQKWLDAVGLEIPETLDEFKTMLEKFKDEDPNGNGLPDEIPLTMSFERGDLTRLMALFGLPINPDYHMQKDGEYIYGPTQIEFRNALEYLHELYAEELLDEESLTQDRAMMLAKGSTEPTVIGTLLGFWALDFCPPEVAKDYVAIPPMSGGMEGEPLWLPLVNIPGPAGMVLSVDCENPEAALRWANYLVENPMRTFAIAEGPEEIGLIKVNEEGKWVLNEGAQPEGMTFNEWSFANALRNSVPWFVLSEDVLEIRAIEGETLLKKNFVDEYRPYFYDQPLSNAHLSHFESEEARQNNITIEADLSTIVENFIAESLMNGIDDGTWEDFQQTLIDARVEELISAYQNSLDTYYEMQNE